jgi:extradiol dioxygenase family protein
METYPKPFHLAVPVHDLSLARDFYSGILGLKEGRSCDIWIDFDFYGNQFVAHLDQNLNVKEKTVNVVDGENIPVPHYGVVLSVEEWTELRESLIKKGVKFVVEPHTRFAGKIGEQSTMFFQDFSGNTLEFKCFKDQKMLFAKFDEGN